MSASQPSANADPAPSDTPWLVPLAEAIEEMLWMWDAATGRVLYINSAFKRFWGSEAPVTCHGRDALLDHVHAQDRDGLRGARAHAQTTSYTAQYRVTQPQAEDRKNRTAHLRERGFASRGPGGELRIIHVAQDVSWLLDTTAQLRVEIGRRTDAERDLGEATQRLQTLIATASDAIVTIDERGSIMDWNNAAERIFGWSRDEAVGQMLTGLISPPAHRREHEEGMERLRSGSAEFFNRRFETMGLRRSGEEFNAELSVSVVRSAERYTFSSFIRDISRRKAAERALAESEAKYRKVVENVNEGILVTAAGRILYANPRGLVLIDQDLAAATSKPFSEFIHPDDRELVVGNHMRRLKGEPVENYYQFRVLLKNGGARWLEISAVVFEWQNTPATLNFLTDATQRRQVEHEIRAALARERELSELKSRFVTVASHELRTPLAAILSSVELLDNYGGRLPEADRKEVIGLIKSAAARMNGMVEQVLLTSRLESGKFAFEPMECNMRELLAQVAAELNQAHAQAPRIEVQCDASVGTCLADATLLRHILVNLLGNALKYSPQDSLVTCSIKAEGEQILLSVQDRGIGIPPADLPRVFESFHRGANVSHIQGTGIGLHIVKECVELHRGTIEVQSAAGEGTVFRARLWAPPQ
jgi:PAS domain S-box-containing protein